tara:strand:- start:21609 stop:21917 length:309 start_codon:yes stop_codon:yes gene_type:complete
MKKIITLSIAILLSLSTFATDNPFVKMSTNKKGMVTKDKELVQTKIGLIGTGLGLFATGFIIQTVNNNNGRSFQGPGFSIGPNQLIQGVGLGLVTIGIVIKF